MEYRYSSYRIYQELLQFIKYYFLNHCSNIYECWKVVN